MLRVEQNLVHLGRFIHFSQKVVGVTLKCMPKESYQLIILLRTLKQLMGEKSQNQMQL